MFRLTEKEMALPKSIEERGARADEFMQKSGTPQNAAPDQKQQHQQDPAPAPAAAATPTPAFDDGWAQKYKVLQGKYNAEVPALNERVRVAEANLQAVQSELAQLRARPAEPDLSQVSAEEREQYGDDFVKFVAKVAAGQAPSRSQDDGLAKQVADLTKVVAETKEQEFFRLLDAEAEGWGALNTDAGFLAWLAEVDELSSLSRQQMFNDAYAKLDVARVARFFNGYARANQSTANAAPANTTPLAQQVVPGVNRAPDPPPQGKPQWSARGIAEFYTALRQGVYRGKEAEAALIEQDIFAAQAEGRVR